MTLEFVALVVGLQLIPCSILHSTMTSKASSGFHLALMGGSVIAAKGHFQTHKIPTRLEVGKIEVVQLVVDSLVQVLGSFPS